jgi:hypothetical protein
MISPRYTEDKSQAERCARAIVGRTTISETFGAITVTGKVHSVVDHFDAEPRHWSVTFIEVAS